MGVIDYISTIGFPAAITIYLLYERYHYMAQVRKEKEEIHEQYTRERERIQMIFIEKQDKILDTIRNMNDKIVDNLNLNSRLMHRIADNLDRIEKDRGEKCDI